MEQAERSLAGWSTRIALLLLAVFLLLGVVSAARLTSTTDEPNHYLYGQNVLSGNADRIDDSKMPVSALNAVPWWIAERLPAGTAKDILSRFFMARLVTLIFSAVVAWLVFRWSRSLYGSIPALGSMLLYVMDPNILAHSAVVTNDLYATGTVLFTFYALWRFAKTRRSRDGVLVAALLGVSQLAKYTAVLLPPACVLVLALHDLPRLREETRMRGRGVLGQYGARLVLYALAAAVIIIVIINAGYLFDRTMTRFGDYRFRSPQFQAVQANNAALDRVPVPLPYPYLEGLDWVIAEDQMGLRSGRIYLLGQLSPVKGFPGYYLIASLFKTPITTQAVILLAIVLALKDRERRQRLLEDGVFMLVPALVLALYFNFFVDRQIGIRHYLVIFPLLFVFAGTVFVNYRRFRIIQKAVSAAAACYLAASTLSYAPNYISYFNELVWDKTQPYKYLADSNLEWGQSKDMLARYLQQHPQAVFDPEGVQAGLLVVNDNDLVGVLGDPNRYAWLRENFEPSDTVAYYYFVYNISQGEIDELCSSSSYCQPR